MIFFFPFYNISRSNSTFFEPHINTLFPFLLKYSKDSDEELSETCIKVFTILFFQIFNKRTLITLCL